MHEKQNSMKKLQGDCVSWLVLLTGAAQLLLVCGDGSSDVQCLELPPIPNGSIEYVALPAITNGSITYAPDNQYNLGTVATYDCDTGFVLDLSLGGSEMRTCVGDIGPDAEGLFDNQAPICVRIVCQPLFPYPYGVITYHHENPPYSYGTRATYSVSCPPELERMGGYDERTCIANGNSAVGVWSGAAPTCAARGIFLSFQGTTYTTNNSNIVLTRIETTNDTSLTCHTDSTTCCRGIDKEPSSTMGTGEWNGTSNFRRKRVSDDGFYYIRFHQAIRLYRNNDTRTPLGTCCRIPDNSGVLRTFCANLIDITIRCPSDSVMAPTNGMVSYSSPVEGGSYVYGTVATFSCSPGFGLNTLETRTCTGTKNAEIGTFSGLSPTCDGITCPAPPNVVNGTIVYSSLGTTEVFNYGTTATYQCNPGYNITSVDRVSTCTGNDSTPSGQWNSTAPQCPPVDCNTPPPITNGSPGIPTTTTFTGTVTYSCNDGYALFGIATSTCQANGTWSKPPECRGVNIGADMPILIGGSVTITCTTDSPADSIMLFQDDQPLHGTVMQSTTILTYTISLVSDSIHGNTFKCEALLANISDTAFDIVIISLDVPQQPITASIRTSSPSLPLIGQSHIVTCSVSKLPGLTRTPTAQWVKVTMETERISISTPNEAALTLSPLRTSSAGRYRCQGNLNTTIRSLPLSSSSNFTLIAQIPTPSVTISRSPSSSALFANHSVVTFTCQVSIHTNIDTPVTLSLTWTREVYSNEDDTTTEVIVVNSTTKTIERSWTFNDFSSIDRRVTCNGTISSASSFIQGNTSTAEDTLSVAGVFLMFNGSALDDNTTSVPARDVRVIQCHSDKTDTFNEDQHGWTFPNGSKVTNISTLAVATREGGHLALTRVGNSSLPAGEYCCKAQDTRGTNHTLCVHVEPEPSSSGSVGGIAAAIVILVVALLIIIGAVILIVARCNVPPVSLKGVVSTGEIQPYEMVEMGHEYEEVLKFQQAVCGEYEIIGAPSQTTGSESKGVIKTEPSPPTPPQPSQATGNDIEFTECVAYIMTTHGRPPQPTGL